MLISWYRIYLQFPFNIFPIDTDVKKIKVKSGRIYRPRQSHFTLSLKWNPCQHHGQKREVRWKASSSKFRRVAGFKWSHQHISKSTVISVIDRNSRNTSPCSASWRGGCSTGIGSMKVSGLQDGHVQSQGTDRTARGENGAKAERCCPEIPKSMVKKINKYINK